MVLRNHTHDLPMLVFCPTRDRPTLLRRTLDCLLRDAETVNARLVVLDDSVAVASHAQNRRIVEGMAADKLTYHGEAEQRALVERLMLETALSEEKMQRFVRKLGSQEWDLGAVRNYALLLAIARGGKDCAIVMVDDDVQVVHPESGDRKNPANPLSEFHTILTCTPKAIVGGRLQGFPDMSTVERGLAEAYKSLGMDEPKLPPRPVSVAGGLFGFRSSWAEKLPFSRTYNEDWIWILGCRFLGAELKTCGTVGVHAWSPLDPVLRECLLREEFGEVFCAGWCEALESQETLVLVRHQLGMARTWQSLIDDEIHYVDNEAIRLADEARRLRKTGEQRVRSAQDILYIARSVLNELEPDMLVRFATQHIDSWRVWGEVAGAVLRWSSKATSVPLGRAASTGETG